MIMHVESDNKTNQTKVKVYPLYNDRCSSNAEYRDTKQTFFEADMFAFLNVDHHGTGSTLF